jgi:hypothetical protein
MLVGEAMAIGQLGLGLTKMFMGDAAREQSIYNEAYKTSYQNSINQFQVEQENKAKAAQYGAKLDYVKQQVENNFLAAQSSWTAEQMRLNEVYDAAAYRSQSMQKMLAQSMGTAAAREVYGKSARRGALVSTLGAYGRTRAQQVDQLISEQTAAKMRMKDTEQQMKAQNKLAIAQTAVLPMAATFSPTPLPGISGGGFGQSLMQLAEIGMGAAATGLSMTPANSSFFGIKVKG